MTEVSHLHLKVRLCPKQQMYSSTRSKTLSVEMAFILHDREIKGASAAIGILLENDEDSNNNDNDIENKNCMHTN